MEVFHTPGTMPCKQCGKHLTKLRSTHFDVHVGFERNHRSIGYGKQCSMVWSCVEENGRSSFEKGIRF